MRIDLTATNGTKFYWTYGLFTIDGPETNYTLHIGEAVGSPGTHAPDALTRNINHGGIVDLNSSLLKTGIMIDTVTTVHELMTVDGGGLIVDMSTLWETPIVCIGLIKYVFMSLSLR